MEDIGVGQRPEDVSWEIEKSLCMVQQLVVRLVWRLTFFVHGRMMAEGGDWYREFFIWEWCDCECDVIRDRVLLGLFVILVLLDGVSVEAKQLSWFIVVVQEGLSAWSKLPWFGGSMEGNLLLYVSPRWPAAAGHPRAWPSPFFNCDESTDLLCFCWCSWRRPSRKVLGSSLDGALSQAIILWTVCNLLISITVPMAFDFSCLGLMGSLFWYLAWVWMSCIGNVTISLVILWKSIGSFLYIYKFVHSSIGPWDHASKDPNMINISIKVNL